VASVPAAFCASDVALQARRNFLSEHNPFMISLKHLPLAAAAILFAAPAMADDLVFQFNNESSFAIVELYASPANVGEWEEDILGQDVLESGEAARITIRDGRRACEYDLRIVFDDGDEVTDTTDLCETESYTVND
jgi:hypothetical protein